MGAAASSEAALRSAVAIALYPPADGKRLPRNPRKWKISHVSQWLRQQVWGNIARLAARSVRDTPDASVSV